MNDKRDLFVLFVEDVSLAKGLVRGFTNKEQITYAEILPISKREEVVEKLSEIELNK